MASEVGVLRHRFRRRAWDCHPLPYRLNLPPLHNARDRHAAGKFMELASSEFGRQVFERYGYNVR